MPGGWEWGKKKANDLTLGRLPVKNEQRTAQERIAPAQNAAFDTAGAYASNSVQKVISKMEGYRGKGASHKEEKELFSDGSRSNRSKRLGFDWRRDQRYTAEKEEGSRVGKKMQVGEERNIRQEGGSEADMGGIADRTEDESKRRSEQPKQFLPFADDGDMAESMNQRQVGNWCANSTFPSSKYPMFCAPGKRLRRKQVVPKCANNK